MTEKKCSNCIYFVDGIGEQLCCKFKNSTISTPRIFIPKEELIRADEKHKFITLLKSDLENFEGLASEDMKNNNIDNLIGNNAVRRYIEETIEVLKEK